MNYLQKLLGQSRNGIFICLIIGNFIQVASWFVTRDILHLGISDTLIFSGVIAFLESTLLAYYLGNYLIQPMSVLWQAILHVAPTSTGVPAPQTEKLALGKDLVDHLMSHIYQLIYVSDKVKQEEEQNEKNLRTNFIAQNLPLPLFVLDPSATIKYANPQAAEYIGIPAKELIGKNVYMVLDMSFPSDDTLDNWLKKVTAASATSSKQWERVKMDVRDNHPTLLFDLAAYYNRDNPEQNETMLILFDHTKQYSQDDQAISFVALSVHELRTPLTLLRGYIEVFEEELKDSLSPEMQSFMEKMRSQAEQLMAFVNNILNVARVDDDQLELKLMESDWSSILTSCVESLKLRAKVRGITIDCDIPKDLPSVGVDRLSIQEVISNLVDNSIKYSGTSTKIKISTHMSRDGLVETTVQDFGLGIPTSIIPNLFTKFYRDHRNRSQIGGTGLGLYLSKAIIQAHGGNLWVRSKEREGSTFGFTIVPYSQISEEAKKSSDNEIVRGAHGWIKNHSLYRR
ncbi:MAG TPA: ATP-binding protein [Candidatus Saccharimonadales bacterium]|nr:ATP-binding protein [Candidatus Saccharimonadales bacterium]